MILTLFGCLVRLGEWAPGQRWKANVTKAPFMFAKALTLWGPSHQHLRYHNSTISYFIVLLTHRKMHMLRCMGSKCCVKFQKSPLKFLTKSWIHTQKYMHFTDCVWFTTSLNCDVISICETVPWCCLFNINVSCCTAIFSPVLRSAKLS